MYKFLAFEFSGFTFRGKTFEELESLIESSLEIQCFCDLANKKVFEVKEILGKSVLILLGEYKICYSL